MTVRRVGQLFAPAIGPTLLAFAVLGPLWTAMGLTVPGEPHVSASFRDPVDGVFYIRNAALGFDWSGRGALSLWYHPLLSWLLQIVPSQFPLDWSLWLLSIASYLAAIEGLRSLSSLVLDKAVRRISFIWLFVAPGFLAAATGNAEIPSLFFNTRLLLSVLGSRSYLLPMGWGALAILTKPNGAYMVPVLTSYFIAGLRDRDQKLAIRAAIGICGIVSAWALWILLVGAKTGNQYAYFDARAHAVWPLTDGLSTFFVRMTDALSGHDWPARINFIQALIFMVAPIPLLSVTRWRSEVHGVAALAGFYGLTLTTLLTANPNKVFLYCTTLPLYAIMCVFMIDEVAHLKWWKVQEKALAAASVSFAALTVSAAVLFVIGTPLGWYY